MKAKSYNVSKDRVERLEKKALELSVKKGKFVKESEIIAALLDKYLDHVNIRNDEIHINL